MFLDARGGAYRLVLTATALVASVTVGSSTAQAQPVDYKPMCDLADRPSIPPPPDGPVTHVHNNDQQLYYRLETHTLSEAQRIEINAGATEWNNEIDKNRGGMNTLWSANYTDSTPGPDGGNNIWEGNCEDVRSDCTPFMYYTGYSAVFDVDGNKHYESADLVFEESLYWDTDGNECLLPGDSGESNGAGSTDSRADQLTWALHELGHFGKLLDSSYGGIMNDNRQESRCATDISSYDGFWMYLNYDGSGSNGASHHVHH